MMNKEQFTAEVLKAEKSLYHIAKSILKQDEDCADAMQNAILAAWQKLHTLKKDAYFKTWITRILINESYQLLRDRKSQVSYEDYLDDRKTEDQGSLSELYLAVQELPEPYRIPFVLHYVEGYSVKEAAGILKLSESAVKVRLYRARNLMKERLKGEYGYETC